MIIISCQPGVESLCWETCRFTKRVIYGIRYLEKYIFGPIVWWGQTMRKMLKCVGYSSTSWIDSFFHRQFWMQPEETTTSSIAYTSSFIIMCMLHVHEDLFPYFKRMRIRHVEVSHSSPHEVVWRFWFWIYLFSRNKIDNINYSICLKMEPTLG